MDPATRSPLQNLDSGHASRIDVAEHKLWAITYAMAIQQDHRGLRHHRTVVAAAGERSCTSGRSGLSPPNHVWLSRSNHIEQCLPTHPVNVAGSDNLHRGATRSDILSSDDGWQSFVFWVHNLQSHRDY
jgi:hypothetical protein